MLKREVIGCLKNMRDIEDYDKRQLIEGTVYTVDTRDYDNNIEALNFAIEVLQNTKLDEREPITVEVMATKAAEGDAYYYELPTGDRLVIREGKIDGVYSPEEKPNEYKRAFEKLCTQTKCPDCPARYSCSARHKPFIWKIECEQNMFEALTK